MRFEQVLPARQTDANREFEDSASQRPAVVVLIALTIIAVLSLRVWG